MSETPTESAQRLVNRWNALRAREHERQADERAEPEVGERKDASE